MYFDREHLKSDWAKKEIALVKKTLLSQNLHNEFWDGGCVAHHAGVNGDCVRWVALEQQAWEMEAELASLRAEVATLKKGQKA